MESKGIKLNIGCGRQKVDEFIGLDFLKDSAADIVANVITLPVRNNSCSVILADQLLEHFESPCDLLDEIHRALIPQTGLFIMTVPLVGAWCAHQDLSHKMITDTRAWHALLDGYFEYIELNPQGVKFRGAPQEFIEKQEELVKKGFYDLAEIMEFACGRKRAIPERRWNPQPWRVHEEEKLKARLKKEIKEEILLELKKAGKI